VKLSLRIPNFSSLKGDKHDEVASKIQFSIKFGEKVDEKHCVQNTERESVKKIITTGLDYQNKGSQ
jgi:hypothetical protein